MNHPTTIRVVAAVIEHEGRYLITQRRPNAVLPLLWEFPGGKVEEGETDVAALRREVQHRLGVDVTAGQLISFVSHPYEKYTVDLYLYECTITSGEPTPRAVHAFKWVTSAEFDQHPFTPADEASMNKLLGLSRPHLDRRTLVFVNRAPWLCVLVGASAALSACDIPAATFGATTGEAGGAGTTTTDATGGSTSTSTGQTVTHPTGGSGGTGGEGGGGEGGGTTTSSTTTSSSTTTTTTTTTTGTGAVVQCNYPNVSNCDPGDVCCFDKSETNPVDECGNPGSCQPSTKYAELQCENNDDCPGEVCCAYFVLDANFEPQWQSMYCDTACDDSQEIKTCKTNADCTFPVPCDNLFGSAYPQYKGCFP